MLVIEMVKKEYNEKVIQGAFDTQEFITVTVYKDRVTITDREMGAGDIVQDLGKILLYRSEWDQVKEYIENIWNK